MLASAHAGSIADAARKPYLAPLLNNGSFHQVLVLERNGRDVKLRTYACGEAAI